MLGSESVSWIVITSYPVFEANDGSEEAATALCGAYASNPVGPITTASLCCSDAIVLAAALAMSLLLRSSRLIGTARALLGLDCVLRKSDGSPHPLFATSLDIFTTPPTITLLHALGWTSPRISGPQAGEDGAARIILTNIGIWCRETYE